MDRHTHTESKSGNREEERSGSGLRGVREEEGMEAGWCVLETGISWIREFCCPAPPPCSQPWLLFPPGCRPLACCSHWPDTSQNPTLVQLQALPAPLTNNTIFLALNAIPSV